ncbi:MAG: hypothetical protein JW797_00635 [Bradymonadales bacterium]|nr:hypothetical protein [Bradymonadales bacterium]
MRKLSLLLMVGLVWPASLHCSDDDTEGTADLVDVAPEDSPSDLVPEVEGDAADLAPEADLAEEEPVEDAEEETIDLVEDLSPEITIRPDLWTVGEVIDTCGNGLLASYQAETGRILIARLQGDHVEMGRQYGCLLGQHIVDMWWAFMESSAQQLEEFETAEQVDVAMGMALDIAYSHFEPYIPQRYQDEFDAISVGAAERGVDCHCMADEGIGQLVRRMLTILEVSQTNSFGRGIPALIEFMRNGGSPEFFEYYQASQKSAQGAPPEGWLEQQERERAVMATCSYFAAWGNRTVDGHMLASRVLDWTSDMGVADYALITVYVPDDAYAYAVMGYTGIPMAGLSEHGIAVGMVGSSNVIERINSASGLIKMREGMETAANLDEAQRFFSNTIDDGLNRPNSIGANALIVWGDPAGGGADAQAIALELNGALTAVFERHPYPDCGESALVYEFTQEGLLGTVFTPESHPDLANLEAEAYEIDIEGNIRTFAVDEQEEFIRVEGHLVDDPEGLPMLTGRPLPCAVFRGDEALSYSVRRWQYASNGPWRGDGTGVMVDSGSYRNRYLVMHDMISAYETGSEYIYEDRVVIEDNEGVQVPIGLEEGSLIAREAAMDSNILWVVYDATALEFTLAYESGRGEEWTPASHNPHVQFDLMELVHPW